MGDDADEIAVHLQPEVHPGLSADPGETQPRSVLPLRGFAHQRDIVPEAIGVLVDAGQHRPQMLDVAGVERFCIRIEA